MTDSCTHPRLSHDRVARECFSSSKSQVLLRIFRFRNSIFAIISTPWWRFMLTTTLFIFSGRAEGWSRSSDRVGGAAVLRGLSSFKVFSEFCCFQPFECSHDVQPHLIHVKKAYSHPQTIFFSEGVTSTSSDGCLPGRVECLVWIR